MTDANKYSTYALKAANTLVAKFYPGAASSDKFWTEGPGFWHSANALECLIDTMTLTETKTNAYVIDRAYNAFLKALQQSGWGYYDDLGWWGVAIQKASIFDPSDTYYYKEAVKIFNELCGGWDDKCGGGLWWKRAPKSYTDRNFKGSISTELFMVLCGRLFNQDKAPSQAERQVFLDWAIKAWLWIKNSGLVDEKSLLWGGLEKDCKTVDPENVPWTYTQGVILGGLCEIYKATGDLSYLDAALPFADITIKTMVWPDGVLREHCEVPKDCNNDQKQFKGIFMRYLGQLYSTLINLPLDITVPAYKDAIERYGKFAQSNADSLWTGYPDGVFGLDWNGGPYTPDPTFWIAGTLQTSALDCFNCATRI